MAITFRTGAFAVCSWSREEITIVPERHRMSYVMISHKVANYAKWKRGVKAFAEFRKTSGEKSLYVCRCSKDPNHLLVWCEWDNAARMKKFIKSRELRKAMKEVGVISKPEISFFSGMEVLSV